MVRQAERTAATISAILRAAEKLFRTQGYADVSIDDIAQAAGCAKGAVYHHFKSKQDVFDRILNEMQAILAHALNDKSWAVRQHPTARSIAATMLAYLNAANQPRFRRILLIDGPVVLGWKRWREIDDAHFAAALVVSVAAIMKKDPRDAAVASATRLLMGAIMEAALACGASQDPVRTAREHTATLELLLSGLQR